MLVVQSDGRVVEVEDDLQQQTKQLDPPPTKGYEVANTYAKLDALRIFPEGEKKGIQITGRIIDEYEAEVEAGTEEEVTLDSDDRDYSKRMQKVKTNYGVENVSANVTTIILPKEKYEKVIKKIKESTGLIKIDIYHKKKDFDFKSLENFDYDEARTKLINQKEKLKRITRIDENKDTLKLDEDIKNYFKNEEEIDNKDNGSIKM